MSVEALRHWAVRQALPLWADAGFDARSGQFVERIAFDGTPMRDAPRRVMVQARQIFVYGLAYERGWCADGARLAEWASRQVVTRYHRAGEGWAFAANREGDVVDGTRDLYAQAFVLLALATIRRLGGGDPPLRLARDTLAFMDAHMAAPAGGYVEALPLSNAPRRQNPHMHLFEALLAWHALVPDDGFDARAEVIRDLLARRFVVQNDRGCALVEHFDEELVAQDGPDHPFEPGHHFEWVWLLAQHERLTGRSDPGLVTSLWRSALAHGFRADGAILDSVRMSGRVHHAGVRLWPLTEAIKASCVGLPIPAGLPARGADDLADRLMRTFLAPARPGLWHDHFDADGRLTATAAPASSLYHLCCALGEAARGSS